MNHIAFEALNAAQLYEKALSVMEEKAIKNQRKVFLAAVMAGVFIGLGLFIALWLMWPARGRLWAVWYSAWG